MKLKMPTVTCRTPDAKLRADALVVPVVVKNGKPQMPTNLKYGTEITARLAELQAAYHGVATAGAIDSQVLPAQARFKRLVLLCIAEKGKLTTTSIRNAAGQLVTWTRQNAVSQIAIHATEMAEPAEAGVSGVGQLAEGILLASFKYGPDHSEPGKPNQDLTRVAILTDGRKLKKAKAEMAGGAALAEGANLARYLGHEPPNVIHPESLATRCRALARQYNLKIRIIDDKQMRRDKMGAFLAVGQGSASKPRMIILEHSGGAAAAKQKPIVIVGKAVTLDTGGYSLKPGASIPDMKYDKQGGMAVIGTMAAASRLKIKRRIVGIVGAAENMISGDAYRPGDIITAYNGKQIEVLNTDAEGRLVLADCLHYAEKTYKPTAMIDLATLTGAVEVALGHHCAGLMATNDELADALLESGCRTDERLWRLPLWPEYREQIQSIDADIKNIGGRPGGSITAGMFLKEFVTDKTPWAHLDIAGTATVSKPTATCPIGATGFGVRLLIDYLQR